MRPGQIRVFDGLRITTEHVDHFQASLHSAIQDIREILGLGIVYAGFQVAVSGPDSVTVQPGLAFDHERNRVACDEPLTLEVSFEQDQDAAYVCVKYGQVEGGETEGRSTLIWDACTVVLRPAPPSATDNLLLLAKVTRTDSGELAVSDLVGGAPPPAKEVADAPTQQVAPLMIRQGVLRLASGSTEGYPGGSIAELVRSGPADANGDGTVTLGGAKVPLDFPVASLTCQVMTSASVTFADDQSVSIRAMTTAEATFAADGVSQFGVATRGIPTEELTEGALARMSIVERRNPIEATSQPAGQAALERLSLTCRAEPAAFGLSIVCSLTWSGISKEELLSQLDTFKPRLVWSNQVAWKAFGRM